MRGVNVELSGGIRDDASLEHALEIGAKRINLGTAALENPEWAASVIAQYGEAIAVGLDVRGTTLAARGWTKEGGDLWQVLDRLEEAGSARYVVTDVTKDGTLQGPNIDLLRQVMDRTHRPVVASGGISSLDDIAALRDLVPLGLEGAIVGKALYAGAFTLRRGTGCRRRTDPIGEPRMPSADRAAGSAASPADSRRPADSAGVPWAGRSFEPNPHAADDGRAPRGPRSRARGGSAAATAGQGDVVAEFARVAPADPAARRARGRRRRGRRPRAGRGQEPGALDRHGRGPRRATGAARCSRRSTRCRAGIRPRGRFRPTAFASPSPRPTTAPTSSCSTPGSATEFVLRRPAVWAVAQSLPWHPPFDSADVRAAFERSIGTELAVLGVELDAGDPDARLAGPELVVRLSLVAGLTRAELDAVLQRLAARWAADDAIATLVDSLTCGRRPDLRSRTHAAPPCRILLGMGDRDSTSPVGGADRGEVPRSERMPLAPPRDGADPHPAAAPGHVRRDAAAGAAEDPRAEGRHGSRARSGSSASCSAAPRCSSPSCRAIR